MSQERVFTLDNLTVEFRTDLEKGEMLVDLTAPTPRLVHATKPQKRQAVYVQLPLVYADTGEPIDA